MKLFYGRFIEEINALPDKGLSSDFIMFFEAFQWHPTFGSTLILVENYDEEFSVHQRNRSQGITLIALRHSLCIVGDRRTAYSAEQVLEGTSFKRGLIFH